MLTYMAIEDGQKPTEFKGFNVRKLTKLVNCDIVT